MKYTLHPWHGAHYGDHQPQVVNALIEIPQGSNCKYEIDKVTGLLRLDRVIYSSFHYPINYGFIPQTLGEDKDPLDILVMCSEPIQPLCLVTATVIGNMQMIDSGEKDDKIIAVASTDPSVNHIRDIDAIPAHFFAVLKNYFEQYKVLENKKVLIDDFQSKEIAYRIITDAIARYKLNYSEKQATHK
ncbi:MAG: inorganic pyrophosphatase [Niastella sp. SCN 39-18]|nr:inorganic diphosphatase [Sphingobacteriales bacterium]ODT53825.1 MAG: inorganic pyrophosphatase [Niastella sp. SCN 39-18]OJW07609.1 MAG: inorganic pyrophosphatase [Sphingobacteriales bacterium 39-19]